MTDNGRMRPTKDCKVSRGGRVTVPAEVRRRWGLADGGEVGFIDVGDVAVIVPGGVAAARAELRRVLDDRYEAGLAAIDEADLWDRNSDSDVAADLGRGQDDDRKRGPGGSQGGP